MHISATATQFEIKTGEKISRGTLAYIRSRVQQWAHSLLIKEFRASGITQAELSRRLDKPPEVVSRLLSRPSNVELDTLSAAIFALRGGILRFSIAPAKQSDGRERDGVSRIDHPPVILAPAQGNYVKKAGPMRPAEIMNNVAA